MLVPPSSPTDTGNKVNRICDLFLEDLHARGDVFHWANTILTAHVRKRPPAYEDALRVLVDLKGACLLLPLAAEKEHLADAA